MLNINEKTVDAYKQKARAQIKEMQAKMQILEASAEKAGADMQIKYQKKLDDWKSRFNDIEMKLDKLSNSSEDAWDGIRDGIDSAMSELGDSLNNAKEQLKN